MIEKYWKKHWDSGFDFFLAIGQGIIVFFVVVGTGIKFRDAYKLVKKRTEQKKKGVIRLN